MHETELVIFVDLRDEPELKRDGTIRGAVHCPRSLLEFSIDPTSPDAMDDFKSEARFIFFCQSGQRSALATQLAQEMGLAQVCHISDGFVGWREADGPIMQYP